MDKNNNDIITIQNLINRSAKAGKVLETLKQDQIDLIVKSIAEFVFRDSENLAKNAVAETGMGNIDDKIAKCKGKSQIIWNSLKGKKSRGVINDNEKTGIIEIAKPLGVIGAVTPSTNPVVTPMCNAMYAIKGANTIIIAPHPGSKKISKYVSDNFRKIINELGRKFGVSGLEDIYINIDEPSIVLTNELMKNVSAVIATGGFGMVKAAYSSGKPSFGVGAGNVQVIIGASAEIDETIKKIIIGRTYDNGIICACEQSLIIQESQFNKAIKTLENNDVYYIDNKDIAKQIGEKLFPEGLINKKAVGKTAEQIGEICEIEVPKGTKVIAVKVEKTGKNELLSKEKMFPMLSIYSYSKFNDALEIAKDNLNNEGSGHSCAIHSNNNEHIKQAGLELPVSRIIVNQTCATNAGGSFQNGLNPTTTLGCGSWGNNSISENLYYTHLLNISRIAKVKPDYEIPTSEQIWN